MKRSTFETWKQENLPIIESIRSAAHLLHEQVGQRYDSIHPYGLHLDMVTEAVLQYVHLVCEDSDELLAIIFGAYFHDSIEDARLTYNDVMQKARQSCGLSEGQAFIAAEIVYALTNEKGRTRAERASEKYYEGIRTTPYAPLIKLADRIANMSYSAQNESGCNQAMRKIYREELTHFLASISTSTQDARCIIPAAMVEHLKHLAQD